MQSQWERVQAGRKLGVVGVEAVGVAVEAVAVESIEQKPLVALLCHSFKYRRQVRYSRLS